MGLSSWKIIINKLNSFSLEKGITSFVNPYSMLVLKEHLDIAEEIDYWYVDGISLVNRINSDFNTNIDRFSFDETSLAPIVFKFAKDKGLKIAIIGTEEKYISIAVKNIESRHSINVNYYRNGFFTSTEEREECFAKVIKDKIDLVVCGMGTPYQENFLIQLKRKGWNGYGFTCGGYLHQIAKKENYYPSFFNKLNLRWLYRIIDEPKLVKRYFIDYPRFFYLFRNIKTK
jgi:N-acetylglucosaminyldiphosphoundecaprenol N-acetyl-beta-D-mannosaminyltransferase